MRRKVAGVGEEEEALKEKFNKVGGKRWIVGWEQVGHRGQGRCRWETLVTKLIKEQMHLAGPKEKCHISHLFYAA